MKHILKNISNKTAIIYDRKIYNYRELKKKIDNLSEGLLSIGIKSGDYVAIFIPNCPEFIFSFFANWQIGAISVPLDHELKTEELNRIFKKLKITAIITNDELLSAIKPYQNKVKNIITKKPIRNNRKFVSWDELLKTKTYHAFNILPKGKVLYQLSSGTTGHPKFIYRTGTSLLKEAKNLSSRIKLNTKDKMLCVLPLPFSYALGTCMLSCLHVGAAFCLENRFSPRRIFRIFKTERITVFPATPFIYDILSKTAKRNTNSLASLRLCISAGAPLKEETFYNFKNLYNIDIAQLYGLTETGAVSINYPFNYRKIDSVGKPLISNKVKIGRGEIIVNNLRTGDLGEVDKQGYLYIKGRKKEIVNIAGCKVIPSEVEKVILSYSRVKDVAVIGIDYRFGQVVKAIVVPRSKFNPKDLIDYCKNKLTWYKVPRIIEFVKEIPRTNTGKILRHKLKGLYDKQERYS